MSFLFMPITDQTDVDSDEDWICCGIMHSFFGSMLFMFGELTKFPTMSLIYSYIFKPWALLPLYSGFFHVAVYEVYIQYLMLITVIFGIIAYLRIYLCLYSHVCSNLHHRIIIICMTIYFFRTLLFTIYALVNTIFAFRRVWHWDNLTELLHGAAAYTIWLTLTFDYAIGSYMGYLTLDFMRTRYRLIYII
ncbi:hypothetical protein Mgra_00004989 [Meloidogyne graminicola]|uniref:Uncharacterized protein n=1 Tax=Meloidogyne graminicola TaxID=189291 RepID=A0A8S9ZQC0_9BILA|nr:hypothetical protein Mgra_00004989 [Meloidogyne graminicola]